MHFSSQTWERITVPHVARPDVYILEGLERLMRAPVQHLPASSLASNMATAVLVPLLLLLLLFSSCATLTVDAAGADELNYNVVATSSFKAKAVCEGPRGKIEYKHTMFLLFELLHSIN
jgi:hypothetical protein